MAFYPTALTAGQYTKLRGDTSTQPQYAADQYCCLTPNVTIFAARINGAIDGATPFAQVVFDTVTTGAYTDIEFGQICIISPTNNRRDPNAQRLRVREVTPTSTILYINETSVSIADNSYIFVLYAYDTIDRLARPTSTTVQAKDFDKTYERPAPVIVGLDSVYVGYIDSATNKLRIALNLSASYPTDNAASATLTYAITFKAGTATVISGSLTTAIVTVDVTEGHQWAKVVATDSLGTSWTRRFEIHACGSTYTPVLGFSGASIRADLSEGYTASVRAFTDVSTVLDGTRVIFWRAYEYYNGVEGELFTGYNIDFVGYLSRETNSGQADPVYSFLSEVNFEIVGVGQRLSQLEAQLLAIRYSDAADEWDEITGLEVPWRVIVHFLQRHTTFLNFYDLEFDQYVRSANYLFMLSSTQGGNVLSVVKGLANQVNGSVEFAPDGSVRIVRDARYLITAYRDLLVTIGAFDNRDLFSIEETRGHFKAVGKCDADGAYMNNLTGRITALRSRAPGVAQGAGAGTTTLNNQVLTITTVQADAQSELNLRAGQAYDIANDEDNELTLRMPDGYSWIVPGLNTLYTWTLDGSENVRGITYDTTTDWLCVGIEHTHDNETGARDVSNAKFKRLIPPADPGQPPPAIAEGEIPLIIPDISLPSFDFELPETIFPLAGLTLAQLDPKLMKPPAGYIAKIDGSTMLFKSTSGTQAFLITEAISLATPLSYDVTPPALGSFTIRAVLFDPQNRAQVGLTTNKKAYILVSDGTNSKVYSTVNIFAKPPTWVASNTFAGVYKQLRGTGTAGSIEIYTPGDSSETAYDFTVSDQGFTVAVTAGTTPSAVYSAGVGWLSTNGEYYSNIGDFDDYHGAGIKKTIAAGTKARIDVVYTISATWPAAGVDGCAAGDQDELTIDKLFIDAGCVHSLGTQIAVGTHTFTWTGTATGNDIEMYMGFARGVLTGQVLTIKSVTVTFVTGNASVRVSADYGITFGAAVTVGTPPGTIGGIDTQRAGTVQYAAADDQVQIATTLGGAFSNANGGALTAAPVSLLQPYYTWGSTTAKNTTGATPDYAVLTNATGSSLKKITGAGTVTDVTPVASFSGYMGNALTSSYGTHVAAVGTVSGAQKLYTTTNFGSATPTWVLRASPTGCKFVRTRRNDTRVVKYSGGNYGQLYYADGLTFKYSFTWGVAFGTRTLPVACDEFDILN